MTDAAPRATARRLAEMAIITVPITAPTISTAIATTAVGTTATGRTGTGMTGTATTMVALNAIGMTAAHSAAHRSPIGMTSDARGKDVRPLAASGAHSHTAAEADSADSGPARRSARDSEGMSTGGPALIASTGFTGTRNTEGMATVGWDPGRHPLLVGTLITVDRSPEVPRGGRISPGTTARTAARSMIGTEGSTGRRRTADVTVGRRGCLPEIRRGAARGQVPLKEGGVPDSEGQARLAPAWAASA